MIKLIYDSLNAELCSQHKGIFSSQTISKQDYRNFLMYSFFTTPSTSQCYTHGGGKAKFSMLCNSTVKQAMEPIAKKNRAKQTKGVHRTVSYFASEFP